MNDFCIATEASGIHIFKSVRKAEKMLEGMNIHKIDTSLVCVCALDCGLSRRINLPFRKGEKKIHFLLTSP